MTIGDPGDTFFPYNVIYALENAFSTIDSNITFIRRKIAIGDPDQSVAICPVDWMPAQEEIGRQEASTQVYLLYIQSMIVDPDQARGMRVHSYLAKAIRELLARSAPLRVGLQGLQTVDLNGVKERVLRYQVGNQTLHDSEQDGNWY